MSRGRSDDALPDVGRVTPRRVLVAGLALAAGTMLVQELLMVLALRAPALLLVAAPLTVLFVLTAGLLTALVVGRLTRSLGLRGASLAFFGAGILAGGLWGYPVFLLAVDAMAEATGDDPVRGAALVGALYLASIAGIGALVGRYLGPWAATRPVLVRVVVAAVLVVAVAGLVVLSAVDLSELT